MSRAYCYYDSSLRRTLGLKVLISAKESRYCEARSNPCAIRLTADCFVKDRFILIEVLKPERLSSE